MTPLIGKHLSRREGDEKPELAKPEMKQDI